MMSDPRTWHILPQTLRSGAHVPKYAALRCSILEQTALKCVGRELGVSKW